MQSGTNRIDGHLRDADAAGPGPGRERRATSRRVVVFTAMLALAACGGRHGDTYAHATDVQRTCCEHLSGDARGSCLQDVVRIEDKAVAGLATNQATYACVVDHFQCDPATGRPTKSSAQAQLDCIEDLH